MSEYSNSATRQMLNLGARLGAWLRTCVAALVEDLAGTGGDPSSCRAMVLAAEHHLEIIGRGKTGTPRLLARLEGETGELVAGLKLQLKGRLRKNVLLRVANDRAVIKQVQLPAGALDMLPAIIRNKVESLAPWPQQQSIWGYRLQDPAQSGQIRVEVGILSRKMLSGLQTTLADAGIRVSHLEIGGSAYEAKGIAVDFLSSGRTNRVRRLVTAVMSIAAVLALGVTCYGLFLAVSAQRELAAVEQRTDSLKKALRGEQNGVETDPKLAEANKLFDRKKDNAPVVSILNTLTKLVPDDAWLNAVDYTGNQLTISGRGKEITKVIESLEKSSVFEGVNFASATQRDPNLNADIFSISATIESQGRSP